MAQSFDPALDDRGDDALRQSHHLRDERAVLHRARIASITEFRALRIESAELSRRCGERRRILDEAMNRWLGRWQLLAGSK